MTILGSACASVQTNEEWDRLKKDVLDRTEQEIIWEQSQKDEATIRQEVKRLLEDRLTRQEALRIALMNNRELQSAFEEIGISKSDLIQAGLFHNPSLGALFRFPFHGHGTNVEIEGFFSISDFWQVPFRKKVAEAQLETTMREVAQAVLDTVRDAKQAYDSVHFLGLTQRETATLLKKFKEICDEVKKRREFGFMTAMDVYLAEVMEAETEMAVHRIRSALSMAKGHLDRMMGLRTDQTGYQLSDEGPYDIRAIPEKEQAIEHALQHRLDIQIAQLKIMEARRSLKLERTMVLREVDLGASYEREVDGDKVLGPGIDIQLPIFDQNQAQIAKAEFMVRRAKKRRQALEGEIREEIGHDLDRVRLHQKRVQILKERVIPLRHRALDYAEQWVGAMQLNRLYLLEMQKGLLESQLEYLEAQKALSHSIADLEHHLGGRLPSLP
jgi:cobalt-zinc-cadmium efflux system outer membrane protein